MRISLSVLAGLAVALAACSADTDVAEAGGETQMAGEMDPHAGHKMTIDEGEAREKKRIVQLLVDRFDAQECLGSDLVATMRRTDAQGGETFLRAYQASTACADDLEETFGATGFTESEEGLFSKETDKGGNDRVLLTVAEDGTAAGVEWEVTD